MAFLDTARNAVANLIAPNRNRHAETLTSQQLPAVDYTPVNIPGSQQPQRNNCWYRLVGLDGRELGYMFLCKCGQSNIYMFTKHDLNRQLEREYHCVNRCASVIQETSRDHQGLPVYKRVVHTEKDKDGNVIPVGAPHSLLTLLPENGKDMPDRERDMVYATLPTWQIGNRTSAQSPFVMIGDQGGNEPGGSADFVRWGDPATEKEYTRRGDIMNGMF